MDPKTGSFFLFFSSAFLPCCFCFLLAVSVYGSDRSQAYTKFRDGKKPGIPA